MGRIITDLVPEISEESVDEFILQGEESHDFVADIRHKTLVLHAVPIYVEGTLDGLILTFQAGEDIHKMDSRLRSEMFRQGYISHYTFEDFIAKSRKTAALVREARQMALRSVPILLLGRQSSGTDLLAECIHNESPFRGNAFVPLDCSIYQEEDLDTLLFGNYTSRKDSTACMAELAQNGTLYLKPPQRWEILWTKSCENRKNGWNFLPGSIQPFYFFL